MQNQLYILGQAQYPIDYLCLYFHCVFQNLYFPVKTVVNNTPVFLVSHISFFPSSKNIYFICPSFPLHFHSHCLFFLMPEESSKSILMLIHYLSFQKSLVSSHCLLNQGWVFTSQPNHSGFLQIFFYGPLFSIIWVTFLTTPHWTLTFKIKSCLWQHLDMFNKLPRYHSGHLGLGTTGS